MMRNNGIGICIERTVPGQPRPGLAIHPAYCGAWVALGFLTSTPFVADEIDVSSDFGQSLASQVFCCQTLPTEMTYTVASQGFAPPEWAFGKQKIWEH